MTIVMETKGPTNKMSKQRLSVRYEGRVQGVGFRMNVADVARGFAVTGRVANVRDGSVDLQAEGSEPELRRFQAAIAERLDRFINRAHQQWSEIAHQSWSDFAIGADLDR